MKALPVLAALLLAPAACSAGGIRLSDKEALAIARKIYKNEAGGKPELLVHWNQGEEFASLGIGHFIWYPQGYRGPFDESFPKLLVFMSKNGVRLPKWLDGDPDCPWPNREEFLLAKDSPRVLELRRLLETHMAPQARFLANRLEDALPKMLATLPVRERAAVRRQFYRMTQSSTGVYALVDYVNFKGEGVKDTERYNGQGWGLLQVLQGMSGTQSGQAAHDEFADSAEATLTRRVQNSPPERNEARWLPSWKKRIQTYRNGEV